MSKKVENPFVAAMKEAHKTTLRLIENTGEKGILNDELVAILGLHGYTEKTVKNYLKNLHTLKMIEWKDQRWFYLKG